MRYSGGYPTPRRNVDGSRSTVDMGPQPDDHSTTVAVGASLNRVSRLSPQDLADDMPAADCPDDVDSADSFNGLFVVDIAGGTVTVFDLRTEREVPVALETFRDHYGTTIWNTGSFWSDGVDDQ